MSKMKHTLCYMAALVGFAACTQDELTGDTGKGQYPLTLTATVAGGADTRATVEGHVWRLLLEEHGRHHRAGLLSLCHGGKQ